MKLNKAGKQELRKELEKVLKEVPNGERIHLDKQLLEDLIFEVRYETLNSSIKSEFAGKKVTVKYIVWSGDFLKKIDLSEVSFDDVIWDPCDYIPDDYFEGDVKDCYAEFGVSKIDLGGSNAIIDFSKSIDSKYFNRLNISHCNFSNVDLSKVTLSGKSWIIDCIFDDTGLDIDFSEGNAIKIFNSSLCNLNLSNKSVDERFFINEDDLSCAVDTNLHNTGLKVEFSDVSNEIKLAYKKYLQLQEKTQLITGQELGNIKMELLSLYAKIKDSFKQLQGFDNVGEAIKKGYLVGCFVNGKRILSKKEKDVLALQNAAEYDNFKRNFIDSVTNDVREQIKGLKK